MIKKAKIFIILLIILLVAYLFSIVADPAEKKSFFEIEQTSSNRMRITVIGSEE